MEANDGEEGIRGRLSPVASHGRLLWQIKRAALHCAELGDQSAASTMLGLVGGGGLGQAIYNNVQLGFYNRLTTLILLIYAMVLASDWIGERLRLSVA